MKTIHNRIGASLALLLLGASLAGCGSTAEKPKEGAAAPATSEPASDQPVVTEPITLTFYRFYAGLSDKEYNEYFVQPLQKKYPNVTLKFIYSSLTGPLSAENILVSGENPDLIYTSNYSLPIFKQLKMQENLTPMIQKTKFDMKRFDPAILEALSKYSDDGNTYAVPFSLNFAPLFYNKDIFDKFGVPYPKDQSTWDDIIALQKQLTRMDNGVQFRGIVSPVAKQFGDQLALAYADNKTKKATLQTEQWKKALDVLKRLYEIPGATESADKLPTDTKTFFQDQTTAMYTNWADSALGNLTDLADKGKPMNWDMTTYPSFTDAPGIGRRVDFHLMMVSPTSKHKELVFDIIRYLTSEEIQLNMTKNARMTALNNEAMKKQFGESLPVMKGKNLTGALKTKMAGITPSDYDVPVSGIVNKAGSSVALNKKDVNTALRDAQEEADKAIASEAIK
ncbi:hypothetical protein PAESOLCIP111_00103 [Paenibacillus solanacearum]|uniref:Extracellular solute-binding protein n=1 Tax=Paenibacillus solanacearum TaxID=2048548 RepID=A0A916NKX4_9BACL|nr:extracellular solute-binding protein [Paenibacillus solanacearum]CAG7596885.1 hypothetical protein PAESOLCIP111_00103 [Paenibacillus solanacearum]